MKIDDMKERGKEFFNVKFEGKPNVKYVGVKETPDNILINYEHNHFGDIHNGMFKVLPEEFNSENGIEMFKERMKQREKEFLMAQARMKGLNK